MADVESMREIFVKLLDQLPQQSGNIESLVNVMMNLLNFSQEEAKLIESKRFSSSPQKSKGLKGIFSRKRQ